MRKIGLIFGLALLLVSCAVVNVYVTFPQEKIDKAMEGLELQIEPAVPSPAVPKKQSRLSPVELSPLYGVSPVELSPLYGVSPVELSPLYGVSPWRFLEPTPLYAQTITSELKTSSPVIDEAQARRRERLSDIQGYKDEKILGENKDGLLDIRSTAGLEGKQVSSLQKMVKEENNDRMIIYRETVKINNMLPEEIKNVQAGAARAKRKMAKDGEWIQNENGTWQEKKAETKK